MRVAVFAHNFFSPSVTFILDQVTGLLDRGVDVQVFTGPPKPGELVHEDFVRYRLNERVHVWPSGGRRTLKAVLRYVRACVRGEQPMRVRALLPYYDRRLQPALVRRALPLLRQAAFDAAVVHFGHLAVTVQALRDIGVLNAPLATFFHAVDVSRFIARRGRHVYDHLFRQGDLMLPISDYCSRKLVELGCVEDKIRVQRMGVDLARLPFEPRTLPLNQPIQLLTIARLTEKKGIRYALQAVARLRRDGREFRYHVVGEGPQRAFLERMIETEGLRNVVVLHGWKSKEQLVRLQSNMHICLAPSVTATDGDQEGIPVALMEAMAVGMPVISTWHAGIPELVQEGFGTLVPERDPDALYRALVALIETPERWPAMLVKARAHISQSYDINHLNDLLLARLRTIGSRQLVA